VSTHDPHSSFIKTPQQLITVVLLAFVVPIFGIVMLVQLVTSGPGADPNAMTPEAVAARIKPVGSLEFGSGGGAAGSRSGEEVVKGTCAACHQAGVAGAPKIGDRNAWAPHLGHSLGELVASVTKGKGAMPPKGGNASLTSDEIARAVVFMANQSGGKFKEPAAKPQPAQAAASGKPAAADGKKVFDGTCTACHTTGVANAPKLGDKAAWAPRAKQGVDSLVQSVLKGKGAMPPKAGNASLSDAEIRAAVEFMLSQAK